MEEARLSQFYYSLWNEFLTETLLPEFHRRSFATHDHTQVQLTPRLRQHRFDPKLYPFIYERVTEFMESVCENYMSRNGDDIKKFASIAKIKMIFDICTSMDANAITRTLAPLRIAFLETASSPVGCNVPIVTMVTEVFRKSVYSKLAQDLRQEAFRAISDDFKIQDPLTLNSYFHLIQKVRGTSDIVSFLKEEWDKPLYARVSKKMSKAIWGWCKKPLPEFLQNTKTLTRDCISIFFFFERGVGKDIIKQIRSARDYMLFQNDGEPFERVLWECTNSETLKDLINQFHDDKQFLETMAYYASIFYADLIYGVPSTENHELFKDETTVKKLISIWFRIHKLLGQENVRRLAVQDALVEPLLEFTNLAAQYPETVMKALKEVFYGQFAKISAGHDKMSQASLEKLNAVSSLSNYLFHGEYFPDVLRHFMSKYLLQVSPENINMAVFSGQTLINDKSDARERLSLILKDASNWVSYRSEMSVMLRQLQKTYENTEIDLRFVRRSLWDLGPDVDLTFPRNLKAFSNKVIETLKSHYPTRSTSIHPLAGEMIIRSNIWTNKGHGIRIVLSTGQGCVLARFGHQAVSLQELTKNALVGPNENMGLPVLVAILKSLMNEYPIVKKEPENTSFCETDMFSLNLEFQPTSGLIRLPDPDYLGLSKKKSSRAVQNNFSGKDLEQILRAATMKLLKHYRELEMNRLRNMVVEHLAPLHDLTEIRFEEVLARLEADDCVKMRKSVVRYIV